MADKVDKLLQRFFRGDLDKQIELRKKMLAARHDIDENIGGGRAQNKQSNAVESMMITHELDPVIIALDHKKFVIKSWLEGLDKERKDMLRLHYGERESWTYIANELHVSEVTLHKWKNEFKDSVNAFADLKRVNY